MIDFLIKSTASLFVLLVIYHLVLENEKMHQFNRFYLLFALVFSLIIPFITIEIIREITNPIITQNTIKIEGEATAIIADSINYWLLALYSSYGLITSLLLIRFIRNIVKLLSKAKSTSPIDYKNGQLILVQEETLPYTFLNTIFINKTDYHNRKIEAELFTHELIHVTQKHTFDILFIESLKVLFWFNPIFIFYKKAIQLNHEFLADEKVVKSYNNVPFYQNLLISKANANETYYLASNLNYSVTKKRLIMMTTTTSTARAVLKKGMLIPVLTALFFSLCTKVVAQEKKEKTTKESTKQSKSSDEVWKNTVFIFRDANKKITAQKKYNELTDKEKNSIPPPPPPAIRSTDKKEKQVQKNKSETIYIDMTSDGPKMSDRKKVSKQDMPPPPPPKEARNSQDQDLIHNSAGITEKPDYPGGIEEFYKFVGKNYTISKEMQDAKVKGRVYLTFIVEKDGSITDIRNIRDCGYGTGEEAIRVMKLSPKWTPGKINNDNVRVMYSLPLTIKSGQ
ncbi:M56 family metallopeptidase [Flavobacterium sp. PL12]|uniref:M56 family metallopeptidase n=1 Tax=Flavobacterium sp. PL12 TaxID=3071718 RepID=UPI00319D9095